MLEARINQLFEKSTFTKEDEILFCEFKQALNKGQIRAAEKLDGKWKINSWVKKGILLGFKLGSTTKMSAGQMPFYDKDTYPLKDIHLKDNIRIVPGGSSIRDGSYVGSSVVIMPPAFINAGAYVDEGTMIDSHALVGSCAQVGKRVHLSAASQLGGVLEPIAARPVIIEDDVFIGGNCGIYEGVLIRSHSVIAAGVIITASTPIYDATKGEFLPRDPNSAPEIPPNAVVIPGARSLKKFPHISISCPVIIKYRDHKSDKKVELEELLR
jgi:2,3,4,5-tetrahydropyridine-2-carboxylate N-succinyltransferase